LVAYQRAYSRHLPNQREKGASWEKPSKHPISARERATIRAHQDYRAQVRDPYNASVFDRKGNSSIFRAFESPVTHWPSASQPRVCLTHRVIGPPPKLTLFPKSIHYRSLGLVDAYARGYRSRLVGGGPMKLKIPSVISAALLGALAALPAKADILWNWSFAGEGGTFLTDGTASCCTGSICF
jgi:hypothetical protein